MSDTQPENLPATSAASDAQTPQAEVIEQREGMFGVRGTGDTSGFGRLKRQIALPGSTPKPSSNIGTLYSRTPVPARHT